MFSQARKSAEISPGLEIAAFASTRAGILRLEIFRIRHDLALQKASREKKFSNKLHKHNQDSFAHALGCGDFIFAAWGL
jgi:hypothetical protein